MRIRSDATSTVFGWQKGSKIELMNSALAPTMKALHKKGVWFESEHLAGVKNTRADWLSRNVDPKDYRLETDWFEWACRRFNF